eukprot:snap_masked-scaffold380_size190731-processed-gene-0.30 protein:Tk02454 transcript:snap_masked-scaffold380_size190731-processed-gene-0.30-mRNA-1 annotation:"aldehyde oxidase 1 isoform x1"
MEQGQLHPVQERISRNHGSQCGFCTPGMVMSMYSLLRMHDIPDVEDVASSLQGNLCRCTGYRSIIDACTSFSKPNAKTIGNRPKKIIGEGEDYLRVLTSELKPNSRNIALPIELNFLHEKHTSLMILGEESQVWYRPNSLEKLWELQRTLPGFELYGGGTGSYSVEHRIPPSVPTIDINGISQLQYCENSAESYKIGSGATISELSEFMADKSGPTAKVFQTAFAKLSSAQVRNVATIGGSLLWGHPSSDLMPIYIALNCKACVSTPFGSMDTPVAPTFNRNSLPPKNVILCVDVPKLSSTSYVAEYYRQSRRQEFALAFANACFVARISPAGVIDNVCIVLGGMEPRVPCLGNSCPIFAKNLMKVMEGSNLRDIHFGDITDAILLDVKNIYALSHVCGTAQFVNDIPPSIDEVQVVLIQANCEPGLIKEKDFTQVLTADGVLGILDNRDIAKSFQQDLEVPPIFAGSEVEFCGQVVAAIVCTSVQQGLKARKLAKLVVEKKELILSLYQACEKETAFGPEKKIVKTQISSAVTPVGSVKGEMLLGGQEHFYLETHQALASPCLEDNGIKIQTGTQDPNGLQTEVAKLLGVAKSRVVVECKHVGGAFGGKASPHVFASMVALGAKKFRRPVRLVLNRQEDMEMTGHRHETLAKYNVSFGREGQICQFDAQIAVNGGFWPNRSIDFVCMVLLKMDSGYTLRNISALGQVYKTNSMFNESMRGFGGPEGALIIETILDRIAHELKICPLEVRKQNISSKGDRLHYGDHIVSGCSLEWCWDQAEPVFHLKRKSAQRFNTRHEHLKRGVSIIPIKDLPSFRTNMSNQGSAYVRIYSDGSVLISTGGVNMGQGLATKLVQIASESLKVPMHCIRIENTRTDSMVNLSAPANSCDGDLNGPALAMACTILNKRLQPVKDEFPDKTWKEQIRVAHGKCINLSAAGRFEPEDHHYDFESNRGTLGTNFTYGVGVLEVEVNMQTGLVVAQSASIFIDGGCSINPAIDIGQIEGGFLQGFGYITMEQLLWERGSGRLVTNGPGTYKIPTVADLPQEFLIKLMPNKMGSANNPPKGIWNASFIFGSAGIYIAIRDAIWNFRREQGNLEWFDLNVPATADKIRMVAPDHILNKLIERNKGCVGDKYAYEM